MRIRRVNHLSSESYIASKEQAKIKPVKVIKASGGGFLESILNNPNLAIQIMVIILTMSSENMQMERRIEGVTTTVEKIRNVADVLNNTMNSVKVAAETPRKIRQLLE